MGRKNHDEQAERDHLNAARVVREFIHTDDSVERLWEVLGGHVVVVHTWTRGKDQSLRELQPGGWRYRIYRSDKAGVAIGDPIAHGANYLPSEIDDMRREVVAKLRLNPGA